MTVLLITLLFGYLVGSLNASLIISHLRGEDIRTKGSGNAGATNTLRVMGKKAALFVLLLDVLKAVVAVLVVRALLGSFPHVDAFTLKMSEMLAGFGAVLGHNFPLYFGFRGGKGVATSFGTILVLDWRIALVILGVFILTLALWRFVSLSSCLGSVAAPLSALLFSENIWVVLVYALLGGLCIIRHRENIARLTRGTERKLGEKKEEQK